MPVEAISFLLILSPVTWETRLTPLNQENISKHKSMGWRIKIILCLYCLISGGKKRQCQSLILLKITLCHYFKIFHTNLFLIFHIWFYLMFHTIAWILNFFSWNCLSFSIKKIPQHLLVFYSAVWERHVCICMCIYTPLRLQLYSSTAWDKEAGERSDWFGLPFILGSMKFDMDLWNSLPNCKNEEIIAYRIRDCPFWHTKRKKLCKCRSQVGYEKSP